MELLIPHSSTMLKLLVILFMIKMYARINIFRLFFQMHIILRWCGYDVEISLKGDSYSKDEQTWLRVLPRVDSSSNFSLKYKRSIRATCFPDLTSIGPVEVELCCILSCLMMTPCVSMKLVSRFTTTHLLAAVWTS